MSVWISFLNVKMKNLIVITILLSSTSLCISLEWKDKYLVYVKNGREFYCRDGRHEMGECIDYLVQSGKSSLVMVGYNSASTQALLELQQAAEKAGIRDIFVANEDDIAE